MDSKYKLIIDSFGKDRFKFNEPLRDYTALNAGGPVSLFFIAFTVPELIKIIEMCRQLKLLFFIFGTGSKILISDHGFAGLVIKNRTKNIKTVSVKGKVSKFGIGVEEALIEVDSGVSINKFCEYLDSQGLAATEFKGMPGSIGGNLFLSRFLQSRVKSIKVLDLVSEIEEVSSEALSPKKHIILSAVFRIKAKV
ncbi:MAG: UDP-N-acetylmuramate dehydrogenase [Microgenomates group bacterium Gr01-1014_7]|nr:MAG: UDP-N-acetylmuramate dehydrogenase [Microgenomates group bacterium Gr01-1014_7]